MARTVQIEADLSDAARLERRGVCAGDVHRRLGPAGEAAGAKGLGAAGSGQAGSATASPLR